MQKVEQYSKALLENISKVIVGKEEVVKLLITALLADGHVILEDVPGTGKTRLSKSLAASLEGEFRRIQFTPDLLPSDVTGMNVFNRKSGDNYNGLILGRSGSGKSFKAKEEILSLSKNTPYIGMELTGFPRYTLVNGKIVWRDKYEK